MFFLRKMYKVELRTARLPVLAAQPRDVHLPLSRTMRTRVCYATNLSHGQEGGCHYE
jgi:hypothetical protein